MRIPTDPGSPSSPILRVAGLRVGYRTPGGHFEEAVRGVDLDVRPGEVVGLVGASGSGKSTILQGLIRLLPEKTTTTSARTLRFRDTDILTASSARMRRIRGAGIAMIFQEPRESLNPVQTVGNQIAEAVRLHQGLGRRAARASVVQALDRVGFENPAETVRAYPHALSGGMCQRVMIAMALACRPGLLLADEPTTALDVTTQAEILKILISLARDPGMGILLVTHDLRVIADAADRVIVLHGGKVMEEGPVPGVFQKPRHPCTRRLLTAMPRLGAGKGLLASPDGPGQKERTVVVNQDENAGCGYYPRCPLALGRCACEEPDLVPLEDGHRVACLRRIGGHATGFLEDIAPGVRKQRAEK